MLDQDKNHQGNHLLRTKIALEAGCDADLGDSTYVENINDAISQGYISEDTVNLAVSRWMNITFQLGQMDIPKPYEHIFLRPVLYWFIYSWSEIGYLLTSDHCE